MLLLSPEYKKVFQHFFFFAKHFLSFSKKEPVLRKKIKRKVLLVKLFFQRKGLC